MDKQRVQKLAAQLHKKYTEETAAELYTELIHDLYMHAYVVLHDHYLAEDAAHEAILCVLREVRAGLMLDTAHSYFRTTARHCATRYIQKRQHEVSEEEMHVSSSTTPVLDVESYVENVVLSEQTLNVLDDDERQIVFMYGAQGYTHKQIAEKLGCPESTVRNKYMRSKKKIHKMMKDAEVEGQDDEKV